jgi:hypothetical protein
MHRAAALAAAALMTAHLTGCGPVISTYLIISAQAELDGAKAAQAEKYAIYEYTAANEYLDKSREEQGYADFGPSIDYAFKANDLAVKARERAESERAKARAPDSLPEGAEPPVAPTADEAPRVIIEKDDSANDGAPVGVEIVPIQPEEGNRPPE